MNYYLENPHDEPALWLLKTPRPSDIELQLALKRIRKLQKLRKQLAE